MHGATILAAGGSIIHQGIARAEKIICPLHIYYVRHKLAGYVESLKSCHSKIKLLHSTNKNALRCIKINFKYTASFSI